MLSAERQLKIAEMVNQNGGLKTSDLSSLFSVSEMTILRDLSSLEDQGVLRRVYGGAVSSKNTTKEISSILRKQINTTEKNTIAQKAIRLISNGESIFLDGSTTALALAKRMVGKKDLTVITNGLDIINELKDNPYIKIISPGGVLNETTFSFTGPYTYNFLSELYTDKAFISAAGISIKAGITVENQVQSQIKKTMLENSLQKIILIDSSKFDVIRLNRVCLINEISMIVTDKKPAELFIKYFKKNNIELIY